MNNEVSAENTEMLKQIYMGDAQCRAQIRYAPVNTPEKKPLYSAVKRIYDIICAVLLLIILAVPMLFISAIIKADSPGAVFFCQKRLGKNGKPFTLYKFRSMHTDAEKNGPQLTAADDERITRAGKLLRAYRLDELPQLINIIAGQMSFVGPRPEREYFYYKFSEYIDNFPDRLSVVPGLTGLAQISGGYGLSPEKKLEYDLKYIDNRSVVYDLKILIKTISTVILKEGAR